MHVISSKKPIQIEELRIILKRAACVFQLEEEHRNLQELVACKAFDQILGTSAKIQEVFANL